MTAHLGGRDNSGMASESTGDPGRSTRRRWWHRHRTSPSPKPESKAQTAISGDDLAVLAGRFAPAPWLRDLGTASWLLIGFALALAGLAWITGQAQVIVGPVIVGLVVATVAAPVVGRLQDHGFGRGWASLTVLLALVGLAALMLFLVIGGIVSQSGTIGEQAGAAADRASGWLKSLGVNASGAASAEASVKHAVPGAFSKLFSGLLNGIQGITSLAFAISFTFFSLFFLLKDGRRFHAFVDRHLGVPAPVARTITNATVVSIRQYFIGVTIVAAFNGIVIGLAALALGVPLAGTIGIVTFVTAYIPFIGAFVAGAFAVILALGAKGVTVALIMLVVVLLANGLLQNIVQPLAFGATLDLHPLVVLVVTISAGALFGMVALILAAPLTSAVVHIVRALAEARTAAAAPAAEPPSG